MSESRRIQRSSIGAAVSSAKPFALVAEAVSFAARAHRHQVRKDGQTPYAAHPFRACLVVRQVFGIDDPVALAAAVLTGALVGLLLP